MLTEMSDKGLNVTRSFEGCSLRAYYCPAGKLTIGRGNTNADPTVKEVLGKPITPGMVITQAQADELFDKSIQKRYMPAVVSVLGSTGKQEYLDVGGDFHYNTGAVKRASWPKALVKGDMAATRASLMSWNKGGGKVLAGLTRRCQRRVAIIERGDYGPEGKGSTRVLSTKAVAAEGTGMLDKGDQGPEVAEVQAQLVHLGLLKAPFQNGTFDDPTDAAVRAFQASHPNLGKDGVVGPATKAALTRDVALGTKATGATVKVGGGGSAVGTAAGVGAGIGVAKVILISTGLVVVGVLLYLAWQYKDELKARVNRATGREVA